MQQRVFNLPVRDNAKDHNAHRNVSLWPYSMLSVTLRKQLRNANPKYYLIRFYGSINKTILLNFCVFRTENFGNKLNVNCVYGKSTLFKLLKIYKSFHFKCFFFSINSLPIHFNCIALK